MTTERVFKSISSDSMKQVIQKAQNRVIVVSPSIFKNTAQSIIEAAKRIGKDKITLILDCSEEIFRLGYGEFEAVKTVKEFGIEIRQAPGLRIGMFICDHRAWTFSPTALYVQKEIHSDETPNAIELTGTDIGRIIKRLISSEQDNGDESTEEKDEIEVGNEPVSENDLNRTDEALKKAPPVAFDIARQIRVFQPYIQYIEVHLNGCSIQRKRIKLPKSIQKIKSKEIEDRLQTTFELIEKSSNVSSEKLEKDLREIRENFTESLGKPWGRVILKKAKPLFDKRIQEFEERLEEHKGKVKEEIEKHLETSKNQIIDYYLPLFKEYPPDSLLAGLLNPNHREEDIRNWLDDELVICFPNADDLVNDMSVDIHYRDVTYETLNEEGFFEALCKSYPRIDWNKPFNEFNAAKEKNEN